MIKNIFMDNHPHFTTPQKMTQYSPKEYLFVSHNPIEVGQTLIVDDNKEGKEIEADVDEILEQRPSKGTFKNHNRPTAYKIRVENKRIKEYKHDKDP